MGDAGDADRCRSSLLRSAPPRPPLPPGVQDPSGNSLEFKAMTNPENLFARYTVD